MGHNSQDPAKLRQQRTSRRLGHTTSEIAAALFISPNPIQDHLKSIFEKVGVRSRKELVRHVFFEHYLPHVIDRAQPAATGFL